MEILESGLMPSRSEYKVGYWRHTASRSFGGRKFAGDYGVYAVIDQALLHLADGGSVAVFAQAGWVPAARNQIRRYLGGGMHIRGILPRREKDDIGLAVASAATHQATETTLEFTYRLAAASWLTIQPSMQWILHPGGNATAETIRVALLRFELVL